MPLTMTAEREAYWRKTITYSGQNLDEIFAELDAACTIAKLHEQKLVETQTRLAATLAHFDNAFGLQMQSMLAVVERDFTMKQEVRSLKTQLAKTQAIARDLLDACEFQKPYLRLTQRDRITVANKIDPIIAKAKGVLPAAAPPPTNPGKISTA